MTAQWTEERIRQFLDGTFTRFEPDGKAVTINVEPDYCPSMRQGGRMKGQAGKPQARWTAEEDIILVELRRKFRPWDEISAVLARSEDSIMKRYRVLRVRGFTR